MWFVFSYLNDKGIAVSPPMDIGNTVPFDTHEKLLREHLGNSFVAIAYAGSAEAAKAAYARRVGREPPLDPAHCDSYIR